jgi:hypothetical protein
MHSNLSSSTSLYENHCVVELIFLLDEVPVKDLINRSELFFCYLFLYELANPMPIQPTEILCFDYASIDCPHKLISLVYNIHCNLRDLNKIFLFL